jgi:hypothetical protein
MSTFVSYAQMLRADAARRQHRYTLAFWGAVDVIAILICYAACVGGAA